jgi:hypothetical protein
MPGGKAEVLTIVAKTRLAGRLEARSPLLRESVEFWNRVVTE